MKMIGMSIRSASRCCSSRPLSPGRVTSSTRQHGTVARGRDRNACADANVSGCQPALWISSSNDSRTETSSSMTKTIDVVSGMSRTSTEREAIAEVILYGACATVPAHIIVCLPYPKRGIERVEQGCLAERLEQALYGPTGEEARTDGPISVGGDEDRWNHLAPMHQFPVKIGARHARHCDVEQQAVRLADNLRGEERFGRCKRLGGKTALPQQVWQRLAHRLVVVNDRHQRTLVHHKSLCPDSADSTMSAHPPARFAWSRTRERVVRTGV